MKKILEEVEIEARSANVHYYDIYFEAPGNFKVEFSDREEELQLHHMYLKEFADTFEGSDQLRSAHLAMKRTLKNFEALFIDPILRLVENGAVYEVEKKLIADMMEAPVND